MSNKRQAVITIGLYQFIGTIEECLAVDELMHNLKQVTNHWVHNEKDNVASDPLPDNYWTICSDPRNITLEFRGRDPTVIDEGHVRHMRHMERRHARWDVESEETTDEVTNES